jgi:hypothetical protein
MAWVVQMIEVANARIAIGYLIVLKKEPDTQNIKASDINRPGR